MSTQRIVDGTPLYHHALELIDKLRAENAALKEENRRLREHVRHLDSDLNTACQSEPDGLSERERLGEL